MGGRAGGGWRAGEWVDLGSGYVQLVARHSGKCLEVPNAATTDGARLAQWTCGTGANQQWRRIPV
ncbi:RICIN domain-containing protein [Micromonospora vinacea]|uniref:RICIN domain-containing protein n=1 Tax=Micromonospora vinacea TaxID=709878 RepID=UPI0034528C00